MSHEHSGFRWVTKENYKEVDDGSAYFAILEDYFKNIAGASGK
jgi:hypothetical protein